MRRAAGNVEIDGQHGLGAVRAPRDGRRRGRPRSRRRRPRSRASARAPRRRSSRGRGACSRLTAPVISRPSACRGDATNWMPKRPRSNTTVPSTFTSASQRVAAAGAHLAQLERAAEEPPRARIERLGEPQRPPVGDEVLAPPRGEPPVRAEARSRPPGTPRRSRCRTGSGRGRGAARACPSTSACVGQASTHARQPSGQRDGVERGRAAEAIRQGRRRVGIRDRAHALLESRLQDLPHRWRSFC